MFSRNVCIEMNGSGVPIAKVTSLRFLREGAHTLLPDGPHVDLVRERVPLIKKMHTADRPKKREPEGSHGSGDG